MSESALQPLRVLIVDDEAPARSRMKDLLADCAPQLALTLAGEADSGRAALELLSERGADLVLLDIRMPEMDGIEVAQHLQKLECPPAVVFTTAYDAYAIRAFEVNAVDYLLKPIRAARLRDALLRARTAARPRPETLRELQPAPRAFLSAQERGKIHLIPIADVIYLKAELKYVTVRDPRREYLVDESLTRLEQEYGDRFVRVHRNCLVARDAIRGFERGAGEGSEGSWLVVLNGCDEKIAVSRRQQHIVREFRKER
ncbi:MAG: two component transcriptional regulator, LytTR family [Burkholderiales bacterium]|jgi:two-component system response regulator AlgR|nr:two component transcriptional regulator, LytTR family [Burkholderiales bacterium]HJQ63845.1 LytTR family DNA-binding domain-containing protein [Burkholderiales bacterium]